MKKFGLLKITLVIVTSVAAGGYYVLAPALRDLRITASQEEKSAKDKLNPSLKRLINQRPDTFVNRGRPRRVLRDDGSDYFVDSRLTPSRGNYANQLKRLDELERKQLGKDKNIRSDASGGGGGGSVRRR